MLSLAERILHSTVRIETLENSGRVIGTGTGFYFAFRLDDKLLPVIVTNKHVIQGAEGGRFVLTRRAPDGLPMVGRYERVMVQGSGSDNGAPTFEGAWIVHPEPAVDLAIFPIGGLLNHAASSGTPFYCDPIPEDGIPSNELLATLSGVEDITMVGYPNGIWDTHNNMPIARRGITATSVKHDYEGLPQFLIDCACFPGSSGSPVMIFNQGIITDAAGNVRTGSRVLLLGVLYAGPQHEAEGEIDVVDIPMQRVSIALTRIPNHLGFVVKARKLLDFKPLLISRFSL